MFISYGNNLFDLHDKLTVGVLHDGKAGCKYLKSDSHLPENCFICFNESPLKMVKSAFYFILKALFVFKIFKFLLDFLVM